MRIHAIIAVLCVCIVQILGKILHGDSPELAKEAAPVKRVQAINPTDGRLTVNIFGAGPGSIKIFGAP
jgi:hypothetical protein